jgi:hypothetical protein
MEALNSLSNFLKKSIEYPASRCRLPIQDGVKIKIHLLWQLNDTFGGHWTKYGDPLIKKYDETDFQKSPTMDKAEKILVTTEECLQNIRSS